ncbi:hypothetical protein BC629DRAFT_1106622 [Irpex lacteus]|nr:hypothetical protein BC629DRAFT_1106622 [Irpex lacteus]
MNHRRALWLPTCVYVLGISLVFIPRVAADRANVTVDDSSSDIVYAPLSGWNVENDCNGCTAHPDPSLTHGGTWHDTSFPPNGTAQDLRTASLEFTGSALYVFCIISQSIDHPFGTSDMTFSIDGNVVGHYTSVPSGDKTYDYNVPVYANDSVGSGSHSFTVTNGTPGGPETLLLLDYIIYS